MSENVLTIKRRPDGYTVDADGRYADGLVSDEALWVVVNWLLEKQGGPKQPYMKSSEASALNELRYAQHAWRCQECNHTTKPSHRDDPANTKPAKCENCDGNSIERVLVVDVDRGLLAIDMANKYATAKEGESK